MIKKAKDEKLKTIIERLSNKINIPKKDIYGLQNGKILDEVSFRRRNKKNENLN